MYLNEHRSRFDSRIVKGPDCWEFQGSTREGYGAFRADGRLYGAHRFAWMLKNGPIPDGMMVCHRCDNRTCVNPDHLFLGTNTDNMRDCAAKGRIAITGQPGSTNHHAKLTEEQVIEIRRRYAAGGVYCWQLGIEFGICKSRIWDIVRRKRWTHI